MTDKIFTHIENAFIEIGYKRNLIQNNYKYADLFAHGVPVRTIERAVFAQSPFDYRSACFGIHIAEDNTPSDIITRRLKALGAPQIFIIRNGTTERWIITEKEAIFRDNYRTNNLPHVITQNRQKWNPETVLRAKSGFAQPEPIQLDFVDIGLLPALENEAANKIDSMLKVILNHAENDYKRQKISFDASTIFRIVFSLLAAKLLKDRDISNAANIDFSIPDSPLQVVYNHYGRSLKTTAQSIPAPTLKTISREIGESFSLRNISVDTLTYIYENTFVSPETRQNLGIHSTPSYVADYVLSQIPIEELPRTQWHVTDPMSGHSIFLIAAMRRMRDLLPRDWGGQQRHNFFAEHLHGVEIDAFSVEVGRMCMMLADFPEPNGWDLKEGDVFAGKTLEKIISKTTILVGNPPFEKIKDWRPETPKPKELLKRALPALANKSFIGLVLPRSFADGSDYKHERKFIFDNFELISLTTLPDRVFLHSDAETITIVARKNETRGSVQVLYKEVKDQQREEFRMKRRVSWEDKVPQSYFVSKMQNRMIVPLLREIWEELQGNLRFKAIADIKIGVQHRSHLGKHLKEVYNLNPFPGSKPGICKVTSGFTQYAANDVVHISTNNKFRRFEDSEAWNLPWDKPKVIVPASRMSRGAWRYAAVVDKEKRIATRRFYAIWPKSEDFNVELLAALLNSPIAEAFVYAHSSKRDIPKWIYGEIPIPFQLQDAKQAIEMLVGEYLTCRGAENKAKKILLEIDAQILKLYNLPPRLERQLLNIFWGHQRPVPFQFEGYIPLEIESWIPLHMYLSENYKEATQETILKKIPVIDDAAFIKYLKSLGREK